MHDMSEEKELECGADADSSDEESENFTVNLELHPVGEDLSGFRTRNDQERPEHRFKITERKGAVGARCTMVEVVHGMLSPPAEDEEEDEQRATLIVLELSFDSRRNGRRIKSADVKFHFTGRQGKNEGNPEVFNISPLGNTMFFKTSQTVNTKTHATANAGAPAFVGVQAGGEVGWEQDVGKTIPDYTRLVGAKETKTRDYWKDDTASWYLMENPTEKTGVPVSLRAAILLKREHDLPFECAFSMKLTLDLKTSVEQILDSFFGSTDDPIIFDPTKEVPKRQQNKLHDAAHLASVDLAGLSEVRFRTILDDTIKYVRQN